MKIIAHTVLAAACAVLMTATFAWGAVTVNWSDALGPHTTVIQNASPNPAYVPSDPLTQEKEFIWILDIDVTYTNVNPLTFSASGNWLGDVGLLYDQLRVVQRVDNQTPYVWTDFHQEIINGDGDFYNVVAFKPGWQVNMNSPTYGVTDYVATSSQYYVPPNSPYLPVGIAIWAMVPDWDAGDGTITFSERPTYLVPEPGMLAAALSGGLGLLVLVKRRRN